MILTCVICRKPIHTSITEEQIYEWQTHAKLIQEIMPNVPAAERELLISGFCNECFKASTKEEEDNG